MSRISTTAGYPATTIMASGSATAPRTTLLGSAGIRTTPAVTTAARPATTITGSYPLQSGTSFATSRMLSPTRATTAVSAGSRVLTTPSSITTAPRTGTTPMAARVVGGGLSGFTTGTTRATSATIASAPRVISAGSYSGYTSSAQVISGGVSGGIIRTQASPAVVRPNTVAGPNYSQNAYEVKHKDDPQLQTLKDLRQTSGLKDVPVGDSLNGFKQMASDGKLTREQFLAAYTLILQQHNVQVPADAIKNAVFDLFDRDDNGVVDMMEIICGVSLLCSGGEEEKIHAIFDMFDENGDGVITVDEMFKFLTSVFKVVLTPNVMAVMNSMGVQVESPEDLASVTARECFETADLNHDGKLSVTEFKNWFYAPRNDPTFLFSPVRNLLN